MSQAISLKAAAVPAVRTSSEWQKMLRQITRNPLSILGLVIVADLLMLVSRVYLGEHWASDVVGGTLLGAWFALPARAPVPARPPLEQLRVNLRLIQRQFRRTP